MFNRLSFILSFVFICPSILAAQTDFFKADESIYFSRASMKLGATWAFDDAADDHYDLAFRIPVYSRFHVMLGAGYRDAEPEAIAATLGVQVDLWRSNRARVKLEVDHTYLYRPGHLLFDDRVRKTTIGLGAEYIFWRRIGMGAEYMPVGFYHGTRHDNPQKGNPSTVGAREVRFGVFYVF